MAVERKSGQGAESWLPSLEVMGGCMCRNALSFCYFDTLLGTPLHQATCKTHNQRLSLCWDMRSSQMPAPVPYLVEGSRTTCNQRLMLICVLHGLVSTLSPLTLPKAAAWDNSCSPPQVGAHKTHSSAEGRHLHSAPMLSTPKRCRCITAWSAALFLEVRDLLSYL